MYYRDGYYRDGAHGVLAAHGCITSVPADCAGCNALCKEEARGAGLFALATAAWRDLKGSERGQPTESQGVFSTNGVDQE